MSKTKIQIHILGKSLLKDIPYPILMLKKLNVHLLGYKITVNNFTDGARGSLKEP